MQDFMSKSTATATEKLQQTDRKSKKTNIKKGLKIALHQWDIQREIETEGEKERDKYRINILNLCIMITNTDTITNTFTSYPIVCLFNYKAVLWRLYGCMEFKKDFEYPEFLVIVYER